MRRRAVKKGVRLSWRFGSGGLALFLVGDAEVFIGEAPFNPASEWTDIVLARRRAKQTVFAAVFCVYQGKPSVRKVIDVSADLNLPGAVALTVVTDRGEERWIAQL